MPTIGAPLDFAKYEGKNFRSHNLGTAPSSPVSGQLYYNTGDNTLYWYDGSQWVSSRGAGAPPDATTTTKGMVQLAGDLTGTATSPQIAAGVITDAEVASANKDGAVGTTSMRQLAVGFAQRAMPGDAPISLIANTNPATANWGNANFKITAVGNPTAATDVANKQYVDNIASGLDTHQSVRVATTANIADLSAGAPNTVDGVSLSGMAGERVLVKNQTAQAQNGIYTINTVGTGSNGSWSRRRVTSS